MPWIFQSIFEPTSKIPENHIFPELDEGLAWRLLIPAVATGLKRRFGMKIAEPDKTHGKDTAMLTIEKNRTENGESQNPAPEALTQEVLELQFPSGLLGFESHKDYQLISDPDLKPYVWLKGKDAAHTFLVIPPSYVVENYSIELADEDVNFIGLENPAHAVVLNIATWHPDESVTVNLKGPIIYNEKTRQARQVVPKNAAELSLAHPMGN